MQGAPRKRAAVLGSPIAHSLSPALHRAAYRELGLDWTYGAFDVTSDQLAGFITDCGADWAGLSLTMPLKEAVLPLLNEVSELAAFTRSANTVIFDQAHVTGENTDVDGILWALEQQEVFAAGSGTVIGAGATARSALAALGQLGVSEVAVIARRPEAISDMADVGRALDIHVVAAEFRNAAPALAADVVISTVPVGAADQLASSVPGTASALLDVVYSPWPTKLASAWQSAGGLVAPGLDMLIGQAAEQVRLMTGQEPPIEAMIAAARDAAALG